MAFNCYATLTLQIHIIKHLRLQVFAGNGLGVFKETVGKGAFAVVNMRYDTEIPYILHLETVK